MRSGIILAMLLAATGLGGCLERDLTVTSEPPGAIVILNSVEVGRTPVTVPFTWYGDYDVMLRLEGYKTLVTHANVNAPIQEYPPFDLFAEMTPTTISDHRFLHYKLQPYVPPTEDELKARADQLRQDNLKSVK